VYFCPSRSKEVISVPLTAIKQVFVPKECLKRLAKLDHRDGLQEKALNLVTLLCSESGVSMEDFGIHGSIALDMHTPKSDIDLVVYGGHNFRKVEKTVRRLVEAGVLSFKFNNRLDKARLYKGKYQGTVFMYNAVRKPEEVDSKYGEAKYTVMAPIAFTCRVKDDSEAMFRPAVYEVKDYDAQNKSSTLTTDKIPQFVTSMIGCYRNVARKGDTVRVRGMLERVDNLETGHVFHHVVVGTGTNEEEYIWPIQR
jgi:predicted nucleotidyltransferase